MLSDDFSRHLASLLASLRCSFVSSLRSLLSLLLLLLLLLSLTPFTHHSSELRPLWTGVLRFLSEELGLCVWPEMSTIPILSVDYGTLNERNRSTAHGGGHGGPVTRGLCLTETTSGSAARISVPRLVWTKKRGLAVSAGTTFNLGASLSEAYVTAILVLSGLPEALTGSILAHEAIHAWLKLHPGYLSLLQRSGGMGGDGAFNRQAEEGGEDV